MGYTSTRYTSTALYFYKQFTQAPNKFFEKHLIIVEKLFYLHFTFFFDVYLHFHVFLITVQSIPKNLRPCRRISHRYKSHRKIYPIEAYLIGKGVVEVSGCHTRFTTLRN
jgi:hypothetical protein